MDEIEEFEELVEALRDAGLNIPDLVEDRHGLTLAVKANGKMVRASDLDGDDDLDDSDLDDDADAGKGAKEEYPGQHGTIQLGHADPAAPYREQIRRHNDAKFQKDWDAGVGRKPKPKAQKGKPGGSK